MIVILTSSVNLSLNCLYLKTHEIKTPIICAINLTSPITLRKQLRFNPVTFRFAKIRIYGNFILK
jgi:hypothetical protein